MGFLWVGFEHVSKVSGQFQGVSGAVLVSFSGYSRCSRKFEERFRNITVHSEGFKMIKDPLSMGVLWVSRDLQMFRKYFK